MKYISFLICFFLQGLLLAQRTSTPQTNSRASNQPIQVRLDVPMVQQSGNNCWEASLAMILAWRQGASVVPEDVTGDSEFWHQWCIEGGLQSDDDRIFQYYGLTIDRNYQSYSPQDYARILQERGPIWVGTDVSPVHSTETAPHAMVITGIAGDGSPNGTMVYINNPWGRTETIRFSQFEQLLLGRLVRAEAGTTRDAQGQTTGQNPQARIEKPVYFVYP